MKITQLLLSTSLVIASSALLFRCGRRTTPKLPTDNSAATSTSSSSRTTGTKPPNVSGNPYAAIALAGVNGTTGSTGSLGALMLGANLEYLVPVVKRDSSGKAIQITAVVWRQDSKGYVVVYLDSKGLPTRTVLGDYILEFSNWSADKTTVDIAKVFTPTGYIEIFKGAKVTMPPKKFALGRLALDSGLSCFPACENDNQNLAALLKLAGLGISLGACGVATTVSLGAMALPCLGVLVTTVEVVGGDEAWLGAFQKIGSILLGNDTFACALGDTASCISVTLEVVANNLDSADSEVKENTGLLNTADFFLKNPATKSGIVQAGTGFLPTCSGDYQCTPGSASNYIPCLNGGYKTCGASCQYSACPDYSSSSSGSGSTTGSSGSGGSGCTCSDTGKACSKNTDCPNDTSIPGVIIPGVCGCPVN